MEKVKFCTEAKYSIGVAAKMLGVSVHLLRVYENEGLLLSERTATLRRFYSDLEIEKARCIRQMINQLGMNFEGIRRLLALAPCFSLRDCGEKKNTGCPAFSSSDMPCWASETKCLHPLNSCRECPVYQKLVHCDDLKELIFGQFTNEGL